MGFFIYHRESMANIYLTIEEVAKRFGVNPTTVYRLAQRGTLPGFKVGNQWRFSERMLESWVAQRVGARKLKATDRGGDPAGKLP